MQMLSNESRHKHNVFTGSRLLEKSFRIISMKQTAEQDLHNTPLQHRHRNVGMCNSLIAGCAMSKKDKLIQIYHHTTFLCCCKQEEMVGSHF